ncbi:MAG: DUF2569 family protein [Gammaproteobacteria bacterium]|nr:DUF2569 family protein [Gammaproteobacteria bacterium]
MTKNTNISGVGGWLAFLVFGLMVLGPLGGYGQAYGELNDALKQFPQLANNPQWQSYQQFTWLFVAVSTTMSFSAGYGLWKIHSPESVRFAILALWLAGPLVNLFYLISVVVIFDSYDSENEIPRMIGGVLGTCIAAAIWSAYLMRSDRVRNTYKMWQISETATLPVTSFISGICSTAAIWSAYLMSLVGVKNTYKAWQAPEKTTSSVASLNESTKVMKVSWWRSKSKEFRLWCFTSMIWTIVVLLFVIVFNPYNDGSLFNMDDSDYFNMWRIQL